VNVMADMIVAILVDRWSRASVSYSPTAHRSPNDDGAL
jgi:hypothetical protein